MLPLLGFSLCMHLNWICDFISISPASKFFFTDNGVKIWREFARLGQHVILVWQKCSPSHICSPPVAPTGCKQIQKEGGLPGSLRAVQQPWAHWAEPVSCCSLCCLGEWLAIQSAQHRDGSRRQEMRAATATGTAPKDHQMSPRGCADSVSETASLW